MLCFYRIHMQLQKLNSKKHNTGQVMLEYVLGTLIVMGMSSMLYLFYQSFIQANLFGSAGESNAVYLLSEDYKSLGLHKMTALPLP